MRLKNQSILAINLALIFLSAILFAASDNNADSIIKEVLKKYEESKNFKADFVQTFFWKLADNINQQKGTIWLEGKEKFRIQTEDQTIVSNGEIVWTYSKTNNQVILDNINNAEDINLPKDILLKFTEQFRAKYVKDENIDNRNCHLLELNTKNEESFIKKVKIWIDSKKKIVLKIEQLDLNENLNTLSRFKLS